MTDHPIPTPQSRPGDLRNIVVPPAMLVCAVATGVATYHHLDLPLELATALALVLFSSGLVLHVLLSRPTRKDQRAKRRSRNRTGSARERGAPKGAPVRDALAPTPDTRVPEEGADTSFDELAGIAPPAEAPPGPAVGAALASARYEAAAALEDAADAPQDWDLRPADLARASFSSAPADAASASERAVADLTSQVVPPPAVTDSVAEQERITAVLRRLASQLRTGEDAPPEESEAATASEPASSSEPASTLSTETSLAEAVDALRVTMSAMRAASAARTPKPPEEPLPAGEAGIRLAAVADALARERVDVFLEPIIGLVDDSARHFEVSVRLRGADDRPLDVSDFTSSPHAAELLPLLDGVRVRHSAGIALKLERSGRDGSVFSEVAGPSLKSDRFVQGVAARQAQGIADRIVLTFVQNEVRGLGPAQFAALAGLRDLGFRFALQAVADLDMDFEALQVAGFEFVKLDADVFLDGLPLLGGRVPSSDICRYFAGLGMTVIVGRVDDEAMRARILGFGVLFGQGQLFGGARPVRLSNPARTAHQAGAVA
jgi:cyclic-di-GMP phosphodiesterase TipF (flagellum assembly factor)